MNFLLKKEARILGLSFTTRRNAGTFVVGTIFRGKSWLDGIATCTLNDERRRELLRLSRQIMKSKQYSQLHAVIISKNQKYFRARDITELARRLKLPVILLLRGRSRKIRGGMKGVKQYALNVNDKRFEVCAMGMSRGKTRELLSVGCAPNSHVPEAVRVADLITKQVTLKWNSLGLR